MPPPAAAIPRPVGSMGSEEGGDARELGMDVEQPPEFYDPEADDKDEAWVTKMRR